MFDNVLPFTKPSKQISLKAYGACHPKINASTVCVGKMTEKLNCEVTMTPAWTMEGGVTLTWAYSRKTIEIAGVQE